MTIEEKIITYLQGRNLPGVGSKVYAEKPVKSDKTYITVQRTGGGFTERRIRTHLIHIDVYAPSKAQTAELSDEVIHAMIAMPDRADVYGCHLQEDYDATDSRTKEYRYQSFWFITD